MLAAFGGGFTWAGAWDDDHCNPFLQLEEGNLCFKIEAYEPSEYARLRWEWHEAFLAAGARHGLALTKPARFGFGQTMTVAVWDGDYRVSGENGTIDMPATLARLRAVTRAFKEALAHRGAPAAPQADQAVA